MKFKNKVAIITGSKQGIGLGIAEYLAKEGCDLVMCDLELEEVKKASAEISKEGSRVMPLACDVSKKEEVQDMIGKTIEKFGKLDILVNNAGIYPYKAFMEMEESDWDKVIDVNLKGTYFCCQEAVKAMKPQSKIVNISSIAAYKGFENLVHYCSSKGGVNGFTRALALELAPKQINVNAVAPGAISTPGAAMEEGQEKQILAMIPKGRIGEPEDIAKAVGFLASDDADYITGQVLIVDGGWTVR
jgi:NAD(P)-dependent dehydrogenase (short-subunit alcohol dehydrogenase family)